MRNLIKSIGLLLFLLWEVSAAAYFQEEIMSQKISARQEKQWNVLDWLTQKKQIALWDAWLATHNSSNLFDFTLSGGYFKYDLSIKPPGASESKTRFTAKNGSLDMYFTILNIYGEYEKAGDSRESFGGAAGLRLLGTSSQDTSLVARYGWRRYRDLTTQEQWDSRYVDGLMQIYLFKYFGIDGSYRYYFPQASNKNNRWVGSRSTGGVFIEALFLRIYAQAVYEPVNITVDGAVTQETRRGGEVGVRMLF